MLGRNKSNTLPWKVGFFYISLAHFALLSKYMNNIRLVYVGLVLLVDWVVIL
jgi:hypothetical protein